MHCPTVPVPWLWVKNARLVNARYVVPNRTVTTLKVLEDERVIGDGDWTTRKIDIRLDGNESIMNHEGGIVRDDD